MYVTVSICRTENKYDYSDANILHIYNKNDRWFNDYRKKFYKQMMADTILQDDHKHNVLERGLRKYVSVSVHIEKCSSNLLTSNLSTCLRHSKQEGTLKIIIDYLDCRKLKAPF